MSTSLRATGALCSALLLLMVGGCSSDAPPPPATTSSATADSVLATSAPSSASFETHPPLTGAAASSVAADLGSGDQAKVTAQLVLPSDVTIDPSMYLQLQALNPINTEDASFKQLSETEAQVYAKVGTDQKDWTLLLIWQDERWQLGDTLEGRQDLSRMDGSTDAVTASAPTPETTR